MVDFAAIGERLTDIRSKSFDAQSRAITYVAATDRPIERTVVVNGKDVRIKEILPPEACVNINEVDQTPILNNHLCRDGNDQLGTQRRAWIEDLGNGVRGVVVRGEMLERDDVRRWDKDIAAGRVGKMSAGYRITKADVDKSTKPWTVTATEWVLRETSFTPLPADSYAQVRSDGAPPQEYKMDPKKLETILETALKGFSTAVLDAVRSDSGTSTATDAERKAADEKAAKDKADAEAKEKADKERCDGDGERKAAYDTAKSWLGTRSSKKLDEVYAAGAPVGVLNAVAFEALNTSPGTARTIEPPKGDQGRSDGKETDFSSLAGAFEEFGGARKDDVGSRVASAVAEALKGLKA